MAADFAFKELRAGGSRHDDFTKEAAGLLVHIATAKTGLLNHSTRGGDEFYSILRLMMSWKIIRSLFRQRWRLRGTARSFEARGRLWSSIIRTWLSCRLIFGEVSRIIAEINARVSQGRRRIALLALCMEAPDDDIAPARGCSAV